MDELLCHILDAAEMWLTWLPLGSIKKSNAALLSPDTCKVTAQNNNKITDQTNIAYAWD
jgi:hypothetical protein